ncbi:hypothetical protein ACWDE0_04495 [Streptomyces sp. 900105755]
MEWLTIGAFAKVCRLSPKALRLYDELDLWDGEDDRETGAAARGGGPARRGVGRPGGRRVGREGGASPSGSLGPAHGAGPAR